MGYLEINLLVDSESARWDAYVDRHPMGSFFHLSGWRDVISRVLGHKCHYLIARRDGVIAGVLPLVEQKSWLFGHSLVSTPFCVNGGVVADSDEVATKLEARAMKIGRDTGVDYVEFRDLVSAEHEYDGQPHCHHATFGTPLSKDPELQLQMVRRKQRAVIRHAIDNGLEWHIDPDVETCYGIYAESVRNLGTPVFDRKLFQALKTTFGERCEAMIVTDPNSKPVSAVLSFYYKNRVMPYYGGGKTSARGLKSNDFMYYNLMCHAAAKGCTYFDFGRSKIGSGSYRYKQHWGMKEQPLHYRVALVNSGQLPSLSPDNPKYRSLIRLWRKMPVPVSTRVGPFLSKYLG